MAKTNIGKMPCETCGNQVTVKANENGTLSYRCDECDAAPYAKFGTGQNEKWLKNLTERVKIDAHKPPLSHLKQEVKATVLVEKTAKMDMWGNLA